MPSCYLPYKSNWAKGSWPQTASPTAIRIMSWNCKCLGKPSTVLKSKKKALEFKPDVMFLMETRFEKERGKAIWVKCGFYEGWEVPREGFSRGLYLLSTLDRDLV